MSMVISDLIRQMQRDFNVTSLVVTHDMKSAFYVGDRIGMLYGGELVQVGSPEEIMKYRKSVVRQFINGELRVPSARSDEHHPAGARRRRTAVV